MLNTVVGVVVLIALMERFDAVDEAMKNIGVLVLRFVIVQTGLLAKAVAKGMVHAGVEAPVPTVILKALSVPTTVGEVPQVVGVPGMVPVEFT